MHIGRDGGGDISMEEHRRGGRETVGEIWQGEMHTGREIGGEINREKCRQGGRLAWRLAGRNAYRETGGEVNREEQGQGWRDWRGDR